MLCDLITKQHQLLIPTHEGSVQEHAVGMYTSYCTGGKHTKPNGGKPTKQYYVRVDVYSSWSKFPHE